VDGATLEHGEVMQLAHDLLGAADALEAADTEAVTRDRLRGWALVLTERLSSSAAGHDATHPTNQEVSVDLDLSDKAVALRHAARLATRHDEIDRELVSIIRLCSFSGASLREIAEATGQSRTTVQRHLERFGHDQSPAPD
jgi:DNA-directed RNA polymerase specialized sigma24 family protein